MKILMTSDTYLPRLGGGEYHVYYVLTELRALGHDVRLLTTEPLPISGHDAQGILRMRRGITSMPSLFATLWRETRKAEIVHAHYNYRLTFMAAIVARLQRKPFILTQHGLGLLPQIETHIVHALLFKLWRRVGMALASRIISTSEDLSMVVRELGFGSKITMIPNGYDPKRFQAMPPPVSKSLRLLTVRRLVPKTGIQYLIQILPDLLSSFPDLHLDIVGDGRLRGTLETQANALGVAASVTFHGAVSHEKVLEHFRQATIVVFPSTAESTSLACIEAMAVQRTVVASRVGGLIELLGENEERGYLVSMTASEHSDYDAPPQLTEPQAKAFVASLVRAIAFPEEAAKKAANAASYAKEHFGWPHLVARTVREVYLPFVSR